MRHQGRRGLGHRMRHQGRKGLHVHDEPQSKVELLRAREYSKVDLQVDEGRRSGEGKLEEGADGVVPRVHRLDLVVWRWWACVGYGTSRKAVGRREGSGTAMESELRECTGRHEEMAHLWHIDVARARVEDE